MLNAQAAVDAESRAKRIETMLRARMLRTSKHKGVDHPAHAHERTAAQLQFTVQEAEIEGRIVGDERRILEELDQLLHPVGEKRLGGQEKVAEAMHGLRFRRHRPQRVEISVE